MGNKEADKERITKAYVFNLFITTTNENGGNSFHSLRGTVIFLRRVEPEMLLAWF